jgi:uncharacterized membrane protein YfcA
VKSYLKIIVLIFVAAFLILFLAFDNPLDLLLQNWIITPIAFIAAGFANATAIGGGFLFVPLFIFVFGLTPLVALKLSLATQAFGMSAGAIGWGRAFIDPVALVFGGIASMAGMGIGTLVLQLPSELIKPAFGWISFLIFVALVLEFRFGSGAQNERIARWDWRLLGYVVALFIGGMVTAWTAIGVGEFAAVYLLFVYGIRIEVSIATGVAILALDSVLGLAMHAYLGGIPWEFVMFTAPGVLVGGYTGARVGRYLEQRAFIRDRPLGDYQYSPLKTIFLIIIFVDSVSILGNHYFMPSADVLIEIFD